MDNFTKKKINLLFNEFENSIYNNILFNIIYKHSKCDDESIRKFHKFFYSKSLMIQQASLKLIGKFCTDLLEVKNYVLEDHDLKMIVDVLSDIAIKNKDDELLTYLISSSDCYKNTIIHNLKKLNKTENLLPLLFSEDDELVEIVKGIIDDKQTC